MTDTFYLLLDKSDNSPLTLRSDVGAAALRGQVVLQFLYLLPVLLQLHLKLLHQATEITYTKLRYSSGKAPVYWPFTSPSQPAD